MTHEISGNSTCRREYWTDDDVSVAGVCNKQAHTSVSGDYYLEAGEISVTPQSLIDMVCCDTFYLHQNIGLADISQIFGLIAPP